MLISRNPCSACLTPGHINILTSKSKSNESACETLLDQSVISESESVTDSAYDVLREIRVKNVNKVVIGTLNINSLASKFDQLREVIGKNLDILTIQETKLDSSFPEQQFALDGYSDPYRLDRNRFGGGIAVYVQNNIPVKVRMDLMVDDIEVIWLQINLPYVKPLLIGCVYRPPSSPMDYLDQLCLMLDKVCDLGHETYFLGDTNIDWNSCNCTLKEKLQSTARACNLSQMVEKPTRVCIRRDGSKSETCIDHIFTNCSHLCSKALSIPVGCSDHNLVVMVRKAKLPKSGPKIVYRRSMKNFNEVEFIESVKNTCWRGVLEQDNPDDALDNFN